jgi:hypothetical protein
MIWKKNANTIALLKKLIYIGRGLSSAWSFFFGNRLLLVFTSAILKKGLEHEFW